MEQVGLTAAALEGDAGTYHLLTPDGTESLCGMLHDSSWWGSSMAEKLPRAEADDRGLTPFEHCLAKRRTTTAGSSSQESP